LYAYRLQSIPGAVKQRKGSISFACLQEKRDQSEGPMTCEKRLLLKTYVVTTMIYSLKKAFANKSMCRNDCSFEVNFMDLQRLMGITRCAVDDYQMIQAGDRIAVGISGGKDSLALLCALAGLRNYYSVPYELQAISVDLGFPDPESRYQPIMDFCRKLEVPYTVVHTDINKIVFEERRENNPCALCAKLRKGAFNRNALALGCNKVAYGHHKDDIVETMMMALIFEGRFYSFSPVTWLNRTGLTVIRPLMYVDETDIIHFRDASELPVFKNPCQADGFTKREYAKQIVNKLTIETPGCRDRLFTAVLNGHIPNWPERTVRGSRKPADEPQKGRDPL